MTIRIIIVSPSKERAIKYLIQKIGKDIDRFEINYNEKSSELLNMGWACFTWLKPDWSGLGHRADIIYVDENFPISQNIYDAIFRPMLMGYHKFRLKEPEEE